MNNDFILPISIAIYGTAFHAACRFLSSAAVRSKDCAFCAVDAYRMNGQGSVPGETAWNVVLTGTSFVTFLFSGVIATFSPETNRLNVWLNTVWKHKNA
jgi:hypothetical protein